MNLASFFSTIGFKIDDAALIELKKKVGEVNNAVKNSTKQTAKAVRASNQEMNAHVVAFQKQQQRSMILKEKQTKAAIIEQRRVERDAKRSEERIQAHKRRLELEGIRHRNRQELVQQRRSMKGTGQRGFSTMAAGATGLARSALAGFGVFELGRNVFEAAQMRAKTNAALAATSGGKEGAAKEYAFLNKEVDRLALNLESASEGFIKLKGSALGSKMAAEDVNKLFSATSELMTVYGASGDDLEGAFRALGQMMSKTKITSEELKGQLSERMYGAVALTAKAAGKDVPGLLKMMEKGEADAIALLPKMAEEFHKAAVAGNALNEALKSPRAALNRLQTQWQRFMLKLADTGALNVVTRIFDSLSQVMVRLEPLLPYVSAVFNEVLDFIGTVASAGGNILGVLGGVGNILDYILLLWQDLIIVLSQVALPISQIIAALSDWDMFDKNYSDYKAQMNQSFAKKDEIYARMKQRDAAEQLVRMQTANMASGATAAGYNPTATNTTSVGVLPTNSQPSVLRIQLDDNLQLQAKMEGIANDQINVQIMKTEAAMPGSR